MDVFQMFKMQRMIPVEVPRIRKRRRKKRSIRTKTRTASKISKIFFSRRQRETSPSRQQQCKEKAPKVHPRLLRTPR